MSVDCPRLVIGGAASGVGKTSIALGLARLFARRGLKVQTFKVGPDFLDPTYLAMASGRTCYNLDGWMTSRAYVAELFARATAGADLAIVEGVMGLFDGASPTGLEGSTAEVAGWLDAPVLLVVGAHGAARSLAATVKGFAEFEPSVRVAGVIANRGGSSGHRDWLAESCRASGVPPLVGMLPRDSLPPLPSRHLGLVTAEQSGVTPSLLDQLAEVCREHLDVDQILTIAGSPGSLGGRSQTASVVPTTRVRLGVAQDEAFHFYYPDNLESLVAQGAEIVPFSPMTDPRLPSELDAIYFGGGYPEVHAERLAENRDMLSDVRQFADSGGSLYAECGGLMYLGRSLQTLNATRYPMAGVLPLDTAMLPQFKALGYAEVVWAASTLWGEPGRVCRGHEFHYSEITADDAPGHGWRPAYTVRRRRGEPKPAGLARGRVLAGYVHLHWASRPDAVLHFLSRCENRS